METRREDFTASDGSNLAVHHMGEGRPVLLLHGLFSSADMNWIRFGHAEKLAGAGYQVIMPDFRAHGQSDAPHDPAAYTEDILMHDMLALIDHLEFEDFDLGGFSLGARTTAKLLCRGITPRRVILGGMGWEGLQDWNTRRQFFIDAINKRDTVERSDPHFMAAQFFKSQKIDPVASLLMLDSFGPMQTEKLPSLNIPIAVICGKEDADNGSAPKLAERLKSAEYIEIPGTHMSSVTKGDLGDAMLKYLGPAEG